MVVGYEDQASADIVGDGEGAQLVPQLRGRHGEQRGRRQVGGQLLAAVVSHEEGPVLLPIPRHDRQHPDRQRRHASPASILPGHAAAPRGRLLARLGLPAAEERLAFVGGSAACGNAERNCHRTEDRTDDPG